jgi:OFA family oxalate/formate antiporter-like MFS transporter
LASVYIAPVASCLLTAFSTTTPGGVVEKGVSETMVVFGVAFLIVVTALAQLLRDPPQGHLAQGTSAKAPVNVPWSAMLSTAQFYVLWLMYFAGAAAGLTFISVAQNLGKQSLGELAFLAVVILAVGNAGGRIVAGFVSDRLGRQTTLCTVFLLQALTVGALFFARSSAMWPLLLAILLVIGANYGANLSLFPSASKDYFGLKGFGLNYGILFTAWGSAGLIMPWVNGRITDVTGSEDWTYAIIIGLVLTAAALTFLSRSLATSPQRLPAAPVLGRQEPA